MLPWPKVSQTYLDLQLAETFEKLLAVKELVNQALEVPRSEGHIGSSLEAIVALQPQDESLKSLLKQVSSDELSVLLITSGVSIVDAKPAVDQAKWHTEASNDSVIVYTFPSTAGKCARCWKYDSAVGRMPNHPDLCERCYQAVTTQQ